jgi:hypothetical protein
MVGHSENAIDESLAFVVGCDREPVDVVLGLRAPLLKRS